MTRPNDRLARSSITPDRRIAPRTSTAACSWIGRPSLVRRGWLKAALAVSLSAGALAGAVPTRDLIARPSAAPAAALASLGLLGIFPGADASLDAAAPDPGVPTTLAGTLALGAPGARPAVAAVGVDVANVRQGPGIGYGKVGKLREGAMVTLLERSAEWFRVETRAGYSGWIAQETLKIDPATAADVVVAKSTAARPLELQARTIGSGLNLRQGPGTEYRSLGKLSPRTALTLVGRQGAWFMVRSSAGTAGWVSGSYLSMPPGIAAQVPAAPVVAAPAAASAANLSTARMGTSRANLRQGPGTSYGAVGKLGARAQVTLLGRNGDWVNVRTAAGATGWVLGELVDLRANLLQSLRLISDVPAAPPAQVRAAARPSSAWAWPTRGRITSGFGYRNFRFGRYHDGVDIANRKNTPIVAARGGTVVQAGWCSGYGFCVIINHGDGFVTEYGHMASRPPVRAGQTVAAGKLIGYMGSTYDRRGGGYSTGNHLHFTVRRNGRAVNPLAYLR